MKNRSLTASLPLALIGALAASGLLLLACEAEVPTPARDAAPTEAGAVDAREVQFTPFTVRPEVRNVDEVRRAMQRAYPIETREVTGTVRVQVFIDDEGIPQNIVIAESSGHEVVDAAALEVAPVLRFTPALNREQRVPVWVEVPITFRPRDTPPSNGA
jgi:TonB family protein